MKKLSTRNFPFISLSAAVLMLFMQVFRWKIDKNHLKSWAETELPLKRLLASGCSGGWEGGREAERCWYQQIMMLLAIKSDKLLQDLVKLVNSKQLGLSLE